MSREQFILLSFDVEEFDIPLEYNQNISEEEQLHTGYQGLETIMNMVDRFSIEASFFTTANFAQHFPEAIRTISQKHEIASHTFYHSHFEIKDLADSKNVLEKITSKKINGLRMPRMKPVEMKNVMDAGYQYDASVNPTCLPGRYNNRHLSRHPFFENGMLRFPASVTPNFRIPLFWLTFKNFPYRIYRKLLKNTLHKDGYVCLYFHPWEFVPLHQYKIPNYIKKHSGKELQQRLVQLVNDMQEMASFISIDRYIKEQLKK